MFVWSGNFQGHVCAGRITRPCIVHTEFWRIVMMQKNIIYLAGEGLTTVGNHNRHIHAKTVRNRLREFGLRAPRPYIGFPLNRAHRMALLAADNFQWGNGDGSFSQMSRGSFFFVRTVDVVYTDVVGNASPTIAFLRGIGLGVARLWSGEGYLKG